MNRRNFVALATFAPVALASAATVTAQEAGHLNTADEWLYEECGQMWPSKGFFETNVTSGGVYAVRYNFTISENEIAALKCVAPKFEMKFVIGGFLNAEDAQKNSNLWSDDLPRGGRKRSLAYDVDNDVTLRYGFIRPNRMSAGEYNVNLEFWGVDTDDQDNPWVAIQMGMASQDEGTITQFLSRGQLGNVIYFNNGDEHGYQYLSFGH